ncbi:potassium efflux system kefa protein / small-conductance mechanosensitive channel [hydrocarbon metagenome]|uniref:Potassium efflux system kefa protein / small-conductance mechanosensitive channel n=1 Tax=hydrocarbon metagenome TaxID=938273 RepID=A0A0W8FKL5_9ZZZZ
MDLLQEYYFGNTLQSWLCALITLIVTLAALIITQKVLIKKLSKLAATTDNQIDDLIVNMIKQTKLFILIIASIYLASLTITIKPSIEELWQKVVILALIFQAGLWASAGISFALGKIIKKRSEEDTSSKTTITFLGFVARFFLWIIIFLLILDNLGVNITGLVAGLGIGGIAVALAVQNILGDLLASLSIVLDKPFVIGDFIVVDSLSGTIEHIGLKTTRIRSLSGEQLIFSNNDLLKTRIRNYKRMSERRIVFSFGIIYQTPLEKLKNVNKIVRDIIEKTENARFDRVHFKEYGNSSLNFEVVYFVLDPGYNTYMDIQQSINLEIFRQFEESGIEFAYPTQTVYVCNQSK